MDSEKVCTIVLPVLIIIRGNSASGKTTIAKRLQQKFGRNTMLISQDVVRREMLKVKDGESTEALPLMQVLLAYGKKHRAEKPAFTRQIHRGPDTDRNACRCCFSKGFHVSFPHYFFPEGGSVSPWLPQG